MTTEFDVRTDLATPWQQLQRALSLGRFSHAWLFHGMAGMGKYELALHTSKTLLCQSPQNNEPCEHCQSCGLFTAGTHPDFATVSALDSAVIKVDQIRQVNTFIAQTSQLGRGQVTLIKEVNRLNHAAANALLKTLEEPADDHYLLLTATQIGAIPATILSRCQLLQLQPVTDIMATDPRSRQAAILANHAPLAVRAMLASDTLEHYNQFLQQLLQLVKGETSPIEVAQECKDLAFSQLMAWQIRICNQLILSAFGLVDEEKAVFPPLKAICQHFATTSPARFYPLLDNFQQLYTLKQPSLNGQLTLETCLIQWQQL